MSNQWQTPQKCVECDEPTKTRVETCGPETGMKPVVSYVCDNEDCEVKAAEKVIEEIKEQAAKPKAKKATVAKKTTAKKTTVKKQGTTKK